jgi:adenylate cyclase
LFHPDKAHDLLKQGTAPIDYCAPPVRFRPEGSIAIAEGSIFIHDADDLLKQPLLAPMLAENKIVFIGAAYPRSDDLFQTPYNTAGAHRRFYGVEVLAHSAATFLNGMPRRSHEARPVQDKILLLAVFIAAIVSVAALFGLLPGVLLMLLAIGGALYVALISSRYAGPTWPHFYPPSPIIAAALMSWALGAGFRQWRVGRELKLVQEAFGGYVGDEILKQMGGRLPEMGGEVRPVAVLFCDIRGFSAIAEKLRDDPARLLGLLNAHFEPLVEALKERGAYVDNYVGDLVMAVFGAPVSAGSLEEDTRQAVRAARAIEQLVRERNAERRAAGEDIIDVGIGVHCGPAVVGNLGTLRKMHYTAIGDTVNIASRIESETRHYPAHLLVTEDVVNCCNSQFLWEFVAETAVKGRAAPVRLYKPSDSL